MNNNYNFIAPFYDHLVYFIFKDEIYNSQIEFIDQLPESGKVLFIGGGSGKVLKTLIESKPNLKVTYLEKSEKMLLLSKKKVKHNTQVCFILGEVEQVKGLQYDAIFTFYLFDLFPEKEQKLLFQKINQLIKPKGLWLIADFLPSKKFKHKFIEKAMFLFLKISTMIQSKQINHIESHFKNQSFRLVKRRTFYSGLLFTACFKKVDIKIVKQD